MTSKNEIDVDLVVVGAGVMGLCVAHDIASAGYSVVVVEKEPQVGGIWAGKGYPGLRLQGKSN